MEAMRAVARAVLGEEGFDFEKTYLIFVVSDSGAENLATILQEQLRLLGIKTEFDRLRIVLPGYEPYQFKADFDVRHSYQSGILADDPNLGMGQYLRCDSRYNLVTLNRRGTRGCNHEINDLLGQAQVEGDPATRLELSHQIELAAMREYVSFPTFWEQEAAAFWPEVRGYVHFPSSSGSHLKWMHVWIDEDRRDDTGNSGQTAGVPGGY